MTDPLLAVDEALAQVRAKASEAIAKAGMPKRSKETLGELIKRRRASLGFSLEQVSEMAGCTKSHIWELEQDRSANPTVAMAWGISVALGVPFVEVAAAALRARAGGV